MQVQMSSIRIDCGTQGRQEIQQSVINEYADAMKEGIHFPPVTVFTDGIDYFLADGFHRYFANKKIGSETVEADVKNGTLREAVLFSLSANAAHGLRRTNDDKRKAVVTMLDDLEWGDWSDRLIAQHCGVSHPTVARIRSERGDQKEERKFQRNGKTHVMKINTEEKPEPHDHQKEMQDALIQQNESLTQELALAKMGGATENKEAAKSLMDELREENRMLRIELEAVKKSRDSFQAENAQMKKQIAMLTKKAKG